MNTESILTHVNDILRMEGEASRHAALRVLSDDLAAQLRREIAAENKQGSALKVITGLLRTVRKTNARTTLHYAWKDEKGRQCVCDGYRAYRLTEPLPLEARPADAGEPINLSAIVPDVAKGGYRAVPLPAARDVRTLIALERAAKGRKAAPLWEFGPGLPAVNAAYLLELMTVLPDAATIYCGTAFSPLYASDAHGDALLLPVKPAADAALAILSPGQPSLPEYDVTPDQFAALACRLPAAA